MPSYAGTRREGLELMNDVAWDEVDVVVTETDACIADALSSQLVELGILYPLYTLGWGETKCKQENE